MSPRDLPVRPHLDHLKNEAKALHKAFDGGDATAFSVFVPQSARSQRSGLQMHSA